MIRALYSAASGMNAQETNVDNIANNLANANTGGYKMRRAQFQDLMYQSMVQPGASAGQQTSRSFRPPDRSGNARRVQRDHLHAGQLHRNRQPPRPGHSGQWLLPDSQGRRHPGLHPRGHLPTGPQRQRRRRQRRHPGAPDHHSIQRAGHHHRAGRHGQLHAAGSDLRAKGRTDPARSVSESIRAEQPGIHALSAHRRVR